MPLPRKVLPEDPESVRETPAASTQEVLKLCTFRACGQNVTLPRMQLLAGTHDGRTDDGLHFPLPAELGRLFPASGSAARRGRGAPGSAGRMLPPLLASEQISEGAALLSPVTPPKLSTRPTGNVPVLLQFLAFSRFYFPGGSVGASLSKLRLPGLPCSPAPPARGQKALSHLGPAASPGMSRSLRLCAMNLLINCE